MAIKTYDADPYFDDFNTSNVENKNYLRILYKPGVSVQVRELNQMQSILQSQIDKLGKSIYKEGAVLDGSTYYENTIDYIDINTSDASVSAGMNSFMNEVIGNSLRLSGDGDSDTNAEVYAVENLLTTGNQRWRLYVRYNSSGAAAGGTETNTTRFTSGDLNVKDDVVNPSTETPVISSDATLGTIHAIGYAAEVITDIGVFFSKGSFFYNSSIQRLFIAKPNADYNITGEAVFQINDVIKTSAQDVSLQDNAAGQPNDRAPGADRYAVDFSLKLLTDDSNITGITENSNKVASTTSGNASTNYLKLLEIGVGQYIAPAKPEYSQLDSKLATRTREESGDYTVRPFIMTTREYRNDLAGNGGLFTDTQIIAQESTVSDATGAQTFGEARYAVQLEPGVAYVNGYRVPLKETLNLTSTKSREFLADQQVNTQARIGNYIELSSYAGLPKFEDTTQTYEFKNTGNASTGITCRIRAIEKVGNNFRLYIYDLSGEIPRTALTITGVSNGTNSNVFTGTLEENNESNPTPILDSGFNRSIITLPYNTIKDIGNGANSFSKVVIRGVQTGVSISGNKITTDVSTVTGKSNGIFFNDQPNAYMVALSDGTETEVTNIVLSNSNQNIELTVGTTSGTGATLIAPVKMTLDDGNGLKKGIKLLLTVTDEQLVASGGTVTQNASFALANKDIYDIVAITPVDNSTDLSASVELDTGQRDGVYKVGNVKYTGSTITTGLKITYRYFARSTPGDYYSVNSYALTTGFGYADIPKYKDVFLTDVLDFRPDVNDSDYAQPDPNSAVQVMVDYYLSKYDRVVADTTGNYKIINGRADIQPELPNLPENTISLYDIYVPAYTRTAKDIQTNLIDNRRFTMKDIGKLEKRIQNIEYYTSLSLLEREANGKQIIDTASGAERFKNGILVDSFLTQGVADVLDPGYKASMDLKNGILRPLYTLNQKRLKYAEKGTSGTLASANVDGSTLTNANRGNGDSSLITLPFTHQVLIDQPTASIDISVNPYDLASWNGSVELSPASDEWIEVDRRPKQVINIQGTTDALANILNENEALMTVYDSVETHILGQVGKTTVKQIFGKGTNNQAKIDAGFPGYLPVGEITKTFQTQTVKEGFKQAAVVNTVETDIGDKILDISFIASIRSRRVYFKAQMLKPNTRVHAFFDGIDVSDYCSSVTAGGFKKYGIDNTEVDESTFDKTAAAAFSEIGVTRRELVSDSQGDLEGFFIIPNNQELKFDTGQRVFKITDSSTNDLANTTTSASVTYVARGLLQTKQQQYVSTRELALESTGERITEVVPGITTKVKTAYYDPLAQSFIIGNVPTGCYTTQMDLFFKAKSSNVPLSVHLVTVENGVPTQKIIPFSKVIKKANDSLVYESSGNSTPATNDVATSGVAISDTAQLATRFKFESPVYLAPGVEYAIVVMSNSPDYRLWMSEAGGDDTITGTRISKNTYAGVSFKSQNASTWTPDQNKDFKMKIWRANFTNTSGFVYRLDPLGIGGSNPNFTFNNLRFLSQDLNFEETNINYRLSIGSEDYPVQSNGRVYFNNVQTITGAGTSSGKLHLDVELTSESSFISPAVDLDRISLVGENNRINSLADVTTTELLPGHGAALARYITREVELNNAADQLNIFINANRPSANSQIKVYVRTKTGDEPLNTVAFTEVTPQSPMPINSDGTFSEVEYQYGDDLLDSPETLIEPFTSFQVKIVFTSTNTAFAPQVKDLRAIATI
jgi:hypothetical protein